jgi:hypothetical protein
MTLRFSGVIRVLYGNSHLFCGGMILLTPSVVLAVGCIDIDRWMDEEARAINYILRQAEIFRVFTRLLITVQQYGISWASFLGAD